MRLGSDAILGTSVSNNNSLPPRACYPKLSGSPDPLCRVALGCHSHHKSCRGRRTMSAAHIHNIQETLRPVLYSISCNATSNFPEAGPLKPELMPLPPIHCKSHTVMNHNGSTPGTYIHPDRSKSGNGATHDDALVARYVRLSTDELRRIELWHCKVRRAALKGQKRKENGGKKRVKNINIPHASAECGGLRLGQQSDSRGAGWLQIGNKTVDEIAPYYVQTYGVHWTYKPSGQRTPLPHTQHPFSTLQSKTAPIPLLTDSMASLSMSSSLAASSTRPAKRSPAAAAFANPE